MKLNKSHIVLISFLSIFLLLSISAVSAASDVDGIASDVSVDDIATDVAIDDLASDAAIDDISGVGDSSENVNDDLSLSVDEESPISDGEEPGEDNPDEPVDIGPINTTVVSDNKTYTYGDTIYLDVSVKDNESNNIEISEDNLIVYYRNETEQTFNHTRNFTYKNSQIKLEFEENQTLPVGNYFIKIQFVNSTIGDVNYTESDTEISLNITKTNTRIDVNDTKVKYGDDVIIPIRFLIESNKSLNNINVTRIKVVLGKEEYHVTNIDGGEKFSDAIKIVNFDKGVGKYEIKIDYVGNNNCYGNHTYLNLTILENNTIYITDDIAVDYENHNISIPISVKNYGNPLEFYDENITLYLSYNNGADIINKTLTSADFELIPGENGIYNLSFLLEGIPLYDAKLTIIYANDTISETTKNIIFHEENNIIIVDNVTVDYENHNFTIPICVNHTAIIIYEGDGKNITQITTLNLAKEDLILNLAYLNGTEINNVTVDSGLIELIPGENGIYNLSFLLEGIPLFDAKLTIIYANDTTSETTKNIIFHEENNIIIVDNVTVDYENHNFTIPICVNHTAIIIYEGDGKNITQITTLNLAKEDLILNLAYLNGTEINNVTVDSGLIELIPGENGIYNLSFLLEGIPLFDAKLTIIYSNGTLGETAKSINFLEENTITIVDYVAVDYENHNYTVPISINRTAKVIYEANGQTITQVSNLNLLYSDDIILNFTYFDGADYINETLTSSDFELISGGDGTFNISLVKDVPLKDAKLIIIYANGTMSQSTKNISFIYNNTIISVDSVKFNNDTNIVTIPISVNNTARIFYKLNATDYSNSTVNTLNLSSGDIILVLEYNDGNENVTVLITNETFTFHGENGSYNISFVNSDIPLDNATVTVIYANSTLMETNKTISLTGYIDISIVPINITADFQDGYFVFQVKNLVTGNPIPNFNVTVGGIWFCNYAGSTSYSSAKAFTTDANGYIKIKNENIHNDIMTVVYNTNKFIALPVGTYNITFSADSHYVLDSKDKKITVKKVQAKIVAQNIVSEFGNVVKYSFKVVNAKTNAVLRFVDVQFSISSSNINATRKGTTDMNGTYTSPSINLTAGTYDLALKSSDGNLINSNAKKTLTINKRLAVITAKSRTIYYGSGTAVIAKLTDKKTGKILANKYVLMQIYTSAKKAVNYAVLTNSKGVAQITTPLTVGKHKVLLTVLDNNYNSTVITRYVTVKKAPAKFTASKVKTYYKSGKLFKIKLINSKNKKAIFGAKMNIKVYISKNKFYNYTGTTSGNGLVQFKINFKPGTYKVVVSSIDKGYTAKSITRKVKVTKSPIKFKPTSLKVKKGKYFKVKVISKKSKKALSGVKVKIRVYTGKKYKTYTKKTNKKGIARVKITQKVGKHKVVVFPAQKKYYSAKKLTKTLKVKK